MDASEAATPSSSQPALVVMPLMIGLCVIASAILALLALHSLVVRLCSPANYRSRTPQEGRRLVGGVDKKALDAMPVRTYTTAKGSSVRPDQNECPVCIGELCEGEPVHVLPNCRHAFHVQCIDAWLAHHSTCPLCRTAAVVVAATEPPAATVPVEIVVVGSGGDVVVTSTSSGSESMQLCFEAKPSFEGAALCLDTLKLFHREEHQEEDPTQSASPEEA